MPRLKSQYRTALVTGASSGLGRVIATMLLDEGVSVWGTGRPGDVMPVWPQTGFTALELELCDGDAAVAVVAQAEAAAGGCFDLVVLNAGHGLFAPFVAGSWDGWNRQLQALVVTNAALAHRLAGPMQARGAGCLVVVTGPGGVFQTVMSVTRSALAALAAGLRRELLPHGVCVLELRCAFMRTDFLRNMPAAHLIQSSVGDESRMAAAWDRMGRRVGSAPGPAVAAERLRRALRNGARDGVVNAGPARWRCWLAKLFVWVGVVPSVNGSEDW